MGGWAWRLAVLLFLAAGSARAAEPVRVVTDHDRVVIACFLGPQLIAPPLCPPGPAVVSEYADIQAGRMAITEHNGMLRRGLPRGQEGASLEACGMIVAAERPAGTPERVVGEVTVMPLAPAPLAATVAEALRLRGTQIEKGFDIAAGGITRRFFLASDQADAFADARAHPGSQINYHRLAGFLRTNPDGRSVADMLFTAFDTTIDGTDAAPYFDLLGVALVQGRLAFAVSRGITLAPATLLIGANGIELGRTPPRCL